MSWRTPWTSPSGPASPRRPAFAAACLAAGRGSTAHPGGTSRPDDSLSQAPPDSRSAAERAVDERQRAVPHAVPHRAFHEAGRDVVPRVPDGNVPEQPGERRFDAASSCSIAPERCPIIGRCMAARTSGWTSVGPGRKNRPNAAAAGTDAVMRWRGQIFDEPLLHDFFVFTRRTPSSPQSLSSCSETSLSIPFTASVTTNSRYGRRSSRPFDRRPVARHRSPPRTARCRPARARQHCRHVLVGEYVEAVAC